MKKKLIFSLLVGFILFFSCRNGNKPFYRAGYAGEDVSRNASFSRDSITKGLVFHITTEDKWNLYAGTSVEGIDFSGSILDGKGSGSFPVEAAPGIRYYFQLTTPHGKAVLAEKHLPMEGSYNVRDMGGIKTKEGKYSKWGKLFRGDELAALTEADLHYLASIPVASVVDFRQLSEKETAQDRFPVSMKNYYSFPIFPGNMKGITVENTENQPFSYADSIMYTLYRSLVTDSVCIQQYRKFFELVQDESSLPLLFHCTAGKDRTGVAAALFLSALGVDDEAIFKDYIISNLYLDNKYGDIKKESPFYKTIYEVKPQYLFVCFDEIRKVYGSIDNFLRKELNVNSNKLKSIYLF